MKTIEQLIEEYSQGVEDGSWEEDDVIGFITELKTRLFTLSREIVKCQEIMKLANINAKSISEALTLMVNLHDKADKECMRLTSKVQQLEHQLEQATSKV